jgi:phosphatidylglycerophosphate synthase
MTEWKTKATDRFILRWIKMNLSARITARLARLDWLRPGMITISAASLGVTAGVFFAFGRGWLAALIACVSQVLDGVDGQFARLTGQASRYGAFLDAVLDRYADGAMVFGVFIYSANLPSSLPIWLIVTLGGLGLIGSNLVSYSSAKAESLRVGTGRATLASKGTRMSVMIICGLSSVIWPGAPLLALAYLAIHPNMAVAYRLAKGRA